MGIHNIYSKRKKSELGESQDVYQYDIIPDKFRNQVIHIIGDMFRYNDHYRGEQELLNSIYDILCREYGYLELPAEGGYKFEKLLNFFLITEESEEVLDVIELVFIVIDKQIRNRKYKLIMSADGAINELNQRFKENGIGYQYESSKIVRIDAEYIHSEAVKPVLKILSDKNYKGANAEFLTAHEHYRHKKYKECINECLKSFESTLKTICKKHGWKYQEKATASTLIGIVSDNNLFPSFMQSQMGSIKSVLESGIPTVRNKLSGHGQGDSVLVVEGHWASYLLHLTATTVLFLVELELNL